MRPRLMFVACVVFLAAFMKISQLNLVLMLFDSLCVTALNANLCSDHLCKLYLFFMDISFR